jgi:GxxExxY protein
MYTENQLSYKIRGAAFMVYNSLGAGLLESVYETALAYELKMQRLEVRSQIGIPMRYKHINFDVGYRLDLLVDEKVIIEIKSVDVLLDIHHKQLLTYLKLMDKRLGLLINFNSCSLEKSIIESPLKSLTFWTKVHKLLNFNYPSLKAGVR